MNIKLTVAYDGTNYNGFQIQPDVKTVEGVLNRAIEKTVKHEVKLMSAGRTDRGVHAMGQVVNFFSDTSIDIGNLPKVINYHLPEDISVVEAGYAPEDFHARFSAKGKFYRYSIYRGKYRNPMYRNALHYPYKLNLESMKESLSCLQGEHDFKSFMGRRAVVKDTIRRIYDIDLKEKGDMLYIDFYGKSFLKNMVRIIVGTAMEIGAGRRDVDFMRRALDATNRKSAGFTAPSNGLCLMKIYY